MKPLFAILIPFTPDRRQLLNRLMSELDKQRKGHDCIIITNETEHNNNGGPTTGAKRNELLDAAINQNASHISFFDSDDLPGLTYIQRNMECVNGDYDCIELYGQYWEHGKEIMPFHHSIIYDHWFQDDKMFYRMPNHLSTIKLDHLTGIRFQDKTVGEDFWYSEAVRKTGKLVRQYPVKEITYYYFAGKRNHNQEPMLALKRGITI